MHNYGGLDGHIRLSNKEGFPMSYPIIPRGSIERDIAKQLHNMVWKQNESEWNANERELKQLRDKRDKDGISN